MGNCVHAHSASVDVQMLLVIMSFIKNALEVSVLGHLASHLKLMQFCRINKHYNKLILLN